ncbi:hypothetical protein [Streptococcus equi]|uniref:hypothetical protein n=1 Tax=Streptococcus equi TaxID=1336 RepID=UPI001E52BC61|nr:hypothetical protein [Streptococcus equi]MCD3403261.1 hypothetical protein [Streptococcus equi subsp. zooepidemicus]
MSFYYNDALNGFLKRPFFKKKKNQYLVAIVGFVLYFGYFLAKYVKWAIGFWARQLDTESFLRLCIQLPCPKTQSPISRTFAKKYPNIKQSQQSLQGTDFSFS